MPETIEKTFRGQVIAGTFANLENAKEAVRAFEEIGIARTDIEVVALPDGERTKAANTDILSDRGFADSQARYYEKSIREGKVLVVVSDVEEPGPIIDIFDRYKAEYNPDGSRNLREDVLGLTTGAVVGAVALGAVGAVVAGPVGAAAGAATGAVLGGGSGAAAGLAAEHRK
jgi:hypothetical protein